MATSSSSTVESTASLAGVFEGVGVLSMAEQLPGPFATMLLADLGANVTLVERPGGGDPARTFPALFQSMARNKRSVCIDLKTANGLHQFETTVQTTDVVVEGFRPGVIVIWRAPCSLLFAIASALFARERTGLGTSIDIAIAECLVSWLTPFLGPALNGAQLPDLKTEPAYGLFTCSDEVVISISIAHEDHFWRSLCGLLNLVDAAELEARQRIGRSVELRARVATAIVESRLSHWAARLDASGIPWSPVHDIAGVAADTHFRQRGLFAEFSADGAWFVNQPVKFGQYGSSVRSGAPTLGEHTLESSHKAAAEQ